MSRFLKGGTWCANKKSEKPNIIGTVIKGLSACSGMNLVLSTHHESLHYFTVWYEIDGQIMELPKKKSFIKTEMHFTAKDWLVTSCLGQKG